jgi:hypothetical protein
MHLHGVLRNAAVLINTVDDLDTAICSHRGSSWSCNERARGTAKLKWFHLRCLCKRQLATTRNRLGIPSSVTVLNERN